MPELENLAPYTQNRNRALKHVHVHTINWNQCKSKAKVKVETSTKHKQEDIKRLAKTKTAAHHEMVRSRRGNRGTSSLNDCSLATPMYGYYAITSINQPAPIHQLVHNDKRKTWSLSSPPKHRNPKFAGFAGKYFDKDSILILNARQTDHCRLLYVVW